MPLSPHAAAPAGKEFNSRLMEMWWLIGSAPDFWGRGSGFESGISHNDPDALQDHCVKCRKSQGTVERETPETKKDYKKTLAKKERFYFAIFQL